MALSEKIDAGGEIYSADLTPKIHRNSAVNVHMDDGSELVDRERLRTDIQEHLEAIGLNGTQSRTSLTKEAIRAIHRSHREAAHERIRRALGNKLERFMEEIANGDEVDPKRIHPKLIPVRSGTHDGDLFRFATLMWSIPVSQGYGRRLRYLVKDGVNGKLIGLFALGDPVFNLRVRDEWIGWNQAERRERLVNLMDAYVVGAMPPYSKLLGGKLVTSLMASKEVADDFEERYGDRVGLISNRRKRARLALITVTSALGRSSIYNRLKLREDATGSHILRLAKLGATVGYGHFQIADDMFARLRQVLREDGHSYVYGYKFGNGPNWRIRVVREGLKTIGLSSDAILKHGINREVYAMPIASNALDFLSGRDKEPIFDLRTVEEISVLALDRWIIPRGERRPEYRQFSRGQIRDGLIKSVPAGPELAGT